MSDNIRKKTESSSTHRHTNQLFIPIPGIRPTDIKTSTLRERTESKFDGGDGGDGVEGREEEDEKGKAERGRHGEWTRNLIPLDQV